MRLKKREGHHRAKSTIHPLPSCHTHAITTYFCLPYRTSRTVPLITQLILPASFLHVPSVPLAQLLHLSRSKGLRAPVALSRSRRRLSEKLVLSKKSPAVQDPTRGLASSLSNSHSSRYLPFLRVRHALYQLNQQLTPTAAPIPNQATRQDNRPAGRPGTLTIFSQALHTMPLKGLPPVSPPSK
ncbi:uncharacterized protein BKA78DRAFT_312863 [Phyllosticta capitalensis]|uniref:uncharacterized protein n=1 Tax=Phyllosticta capitalensis TaxID=121624 RepID=UPI00312E81F4